jgi:hypothetical protein
MGMGSSIQLNGFLETMADPEDHYELLEKGSFSLIRGKGAK